MRLKLGKEEENLQGLILIRIKVVWSVLCKVYKVVLFLV